MKIYMADAAIPTEMNCSTMDSYQDEAYIAVMCWSYPSVFSLTITMALPISSARQLA